MLSYFEIGEPRIVGIDASPVDTSILIRADAFYVTVYDRKA